MEAPMAFATRRVALERLLLRRARQRSASVARAKESISTARPAGTPNARVPAALLKYNDDAVRQLLSPGWRRNYVTYDELNDILPAGEVSSEEIEQVFEAICRLSIEVTES
jgi:sigma-70-like protein